MSEIIEYGIRYQTRKGERWVIDDSGTVIRSVSIGAMRAQLKHWLSESEYSDKTSNDRICAFGPDGEPVELEAQQQAGPTPIELLRRYEWVYDTDGLHYCPECESQQDDGHEPDCELAALLREVGRE